jgi:phage-related protein
MDENLQPLLWVGSSKKDLLKMPADIQDIFGFALHLAQSGQKHPDAKPLKGFAGAGVLEVVENYKKDTYRAVYTVRYADTVYVLHCFQKKSKKGIATPKQDIKLIESRLKNIESSIGGKS